MKLQSTAFCVMHRIDWSRSSKNFLLKILLYFQSFKYRSGMVYPTIADKEISLNLFLNNFVFKKYIIILLKYFFNHSASVAELSSDSPDCWSRVALILDTRFKTSQNRTRDTRKIRVATWHPTRHLS